MWQLLMWMCLWCAQLWYAIWYTAVTIIFSLFCSRQTSLSRRLLEGSGRKYQKKNRSQPVMYIVCNRVNLACFVAWIYRNVFNIKYCGYSFPMPAVSGCKANDVDIVYTMWSNLKKTPGMDVGQVGFHRQKEVIQWLSVLLCGDTVNWNGT